MSDINELLYGKTYSDKEDKFENGIIELEKKHCAFFNGRNSLFFSGEADHLEEHLNEYYVGNVLSIAFDKKSDLPEHIKKEVMDLFQDVWGKKN